MEIFLKEKIDLMISNRNEINNLKLTSGDERYFMALYISIKNEVADSSKINEVKKYITDSTGIFSAFKGESIYFLATILSIEKEYNLLFDKVLEVYNKYKDKGFHGNSYLTIASYIIAKNYEKSNYDKIIEKSKMVFDKLEKTTSIINRNDYYILSSIVAILDLDIEKINYKAEKIYNLFVANKSKYSYNSNFSNTSLLLSMCNGEAEDIIERFDYILNYLYKKKIKLSSNSYNTICNLLLISKNIEEDLESLVNGYEYLSKIKGYGLIAIGSDLRFILIAELLMSKYEDNETSAGIISMNLISIMSSQYAAIIGSNSIT